MSIDRFWHQVRGIVVVAVVLILWAMGVGRGSWRRTRTFKLEMGRINWERSGPCDTVFSLFMLNELNVMTFIPCIRLQGSRFIIVRGVTGLSSGMVSTYVE
jgi:hypothetical protein